jgi:three-Cys-motif partner protein
MPADRKGHYSQLDGLICRGSGFWAREKLHYIGRYMDIFNGGMKNHWPNRAFVDLMAGPGRCMLDSREEFDGSPLLALKCDPPFTSVVLVESDLNLLDAVRRRTAAYGDRVQIVHGDCNDDGVIETIRTAVPPDSLTLAFADMLGLDVRFETLDRLTKSRKMDLAITFQVGDLVRNVPQVLGGRQESRRLDEFFGASGWCEVVTEARMRGVPIEDALTTYYVERLSTLGYAHVVPLHVLMKNTKNAPLYRLIVAGRHRRAAEFFQKISRIEYSGQRTLLD